MTVGKRYSGDESEGQRQVCLIQIDVKGESINLLNDSRRKNTTANILFCDNISRDSKANMLVELLFMSKTKKELQITSNPRSCVVLCCPSRWMIEIQYRLIEVGFLWVHVTLQWREQISILKVCLKFLFKLDKGFLANWGLEIPIMQFLSCILSCYARVIGCKVNLLTKKTNRVVEETSWCGMGNESIPSTERTRKAGTWWSLEMHESEVRPK